MRRLFVAVLAAAFVAGPLRAPAAAPKPLSFEALRNLVSVREAQIAPDGSRIAYIRSTGDYKADRTDSELVLVDAIGTGRRVITHDRIGVHTPRWSPAGDRIAYLASPARGKPAQLYVLPMNGGDSAQITTVKSGIDGYAWRPDGNGFAYVAQDDPPKTKLPEDYVPGFPVTDEHFLTREPSKPSHVWTIGADGKGAKQITKGDMTPDGKIAWTPDAHAVIMNAKPDPIFAHLTKARTMIVDVGSGEAKPVRSDALDSGFALSHDGKRIAFYGNDRDGVSFDVYVADIVAGTAPHLVVGAHAETWYPLGWSIDDQKLLLWKYFSVSESYLYIANVATGELAPLDKSPRKVGIRAARFAPDGRGVYVVSDEDGEFAQLRYVDIVTHESRKLSAHIPWDIDSFDASADGRYLAYVSNQDGTSRLTVVDNVQKLELIPPGIPDGHIYEVRFDRAGRRLAFSAESAQTPRDVYVYDVTHNTLERWTHSEPGPIDARTFVGAELIRYPTWDRVDGRPRLISAYLYQPRTPGPHPVLINIHGGPESQYRPDFDAFTQFLVNELGYVVIAPNVRGSSGYGKSFLALDNGMLREDAVKDIGSLLVWIGLQRELDRDRVVVMGGSYGGYMALASLAAYNDRLRGGIDVVGISNFVSFLSGTSAYRRDLRRAEYGDERDVRMRGYLSRISPLTNAASIRRPLFVVQGLNDPRVPPAESEQLVARIRAGGGEVWYLAAKDEGHGFHKKTNRDFYMQTAALFLQRLAQP